MRWGTRNHEYISENSAKAQVKVKGIWSKGFDIRAIDCLDYQIRIWV